MDLYNSSPAAPPVRNGADTHLLATYGFVNSIHMTRRVMSRHSLSLLISTTGLPATLLAILPVFFLPLDSLKFLSNFSHRHREGHFRGHAFQRVYPEGVCFRRPFFGWIFCSCFHCWCPPYIGSCRCRLLPWSYNAACCWTRFSKSFKLCYVCCESFPCFPNFQWCCFTRSHWHDLDANQFVASNRQLQRRGIMILFVTRKLILITVM